MTPQFFESTSPLSHRIAYTEWGEAGNPRAVLCLHGLTRNGRDFDDLAQALAKDYRVICPDMPGRGASDFFTDHTHYTNAVYAADCLALLDHLGIAQCGWVGTSMGGIVGMMVAAAQPERIGKLVLNDVGMTISASGLARIATYAGKQIRFASQTEAEAALKAVYAPFGITEAAQWRHFLMHSLKGLPDGGVTLAYDPAIVQGLIDAKDIQDIDLSALWNAIACPTLILRGSESDILLHQTAKTMAESRPGVTLVEFPGIGHAPSLMRAQEIATVRGWLLGR